MTSIIISFDFNFRVDSFTSLNKFLSFLNRPFNLGHSHLIPMVFLSHSVFSLFYNEISSIIRFISYKI